MINFEQVKMYLPQYLSSVDQKTLFKEIKSFPNNIDKRMYTLKLMQDNSFYQGDGIKDLLVVDLKSRTFLKTPSIILSNTCDVDPLNKRLFTTRILYAPILNLNKYENALINNFVLTGLETSERINAHISDVKKQFITNIFYLPYTQGLGNESIVFLDAIINCPLDELSLDNISTNRLFSLSDYGFYMLLIKLSIHFTRVREGVSRGSDN